MKKISFVLLFLLVSVSAMAQVKFQDLAIKEAVAKAKAENKLVMILASTTW